MIASEPAVEATASLHSPPRGWPAAFKENKKLSAFLNRIIKAKRARLTTFPPPADIMMEVADLLPFSKDGAANASRVTAAVGWPTVRGFAVYELEDAPDTFVAKVHEWSLHPRNVWVDCTPRPAHLTEVLLVEAKVEEALFRGQMVRSAAPTAHATVDISDAPSPASAAAPPRLRTPAAPAPPPAVTAPPPAAAAPTAPAHDDDAPTSEALSYDEILASLSLGPKALGKGAKPKKAPTDPLKIVERLTAEHGVRKWWVGPPDNQKKMEQRWPPPCSQVRMRIRHNRTFEIEAQCWGKKRELDDDFLMIMGDLPWFAPLHYGDTDAAQLRIYGSTFVGADGRFSRLKVDKVEELRNGKRPPPLTEADIYRVCGKSLLNGLDSHRSGRNLVITLDRDLDWHIQFRTDGDDGWARGSDDSD